MIHTDNNTNFKQIATSTAILDSHYLDIISNIQGTAKTGYAFNEVVTATIQYLTYNSFPHLTDSEYTLTHFKGFLDQINTKEQFGYRPMLEVPYNSNLKNEDIKYNNVTYLREAYCFIQLAYYLNENDLTKTDFFKYTMHYSTTNEKLDDALYTDDLSYLHKEYEKIDKNGKDRYKHSINKHFFGCMLLILNDLKLPTTHFNEVTKENRTYNAMVQTPRDWRKVFPFELLEYDVKSAFPVFVDHLIGSNVGANVYELIMQTYEVDRPQAKILFNTWLNRTKYKTAKEFTAFFAPIYKEYTPKLVAYLTDKSNPIWQKMNELEKRCIDFLTHINGVHNGTRLHDAYFIINNDYYNKISNTDFGLATFGEKKFSPTELNITLNTTKKISKGYESAINKHSDMSIISSQYFNENVGCVNVGYFTIYDEYFQCYKSNFNVGVNGMYQDGEYIFYTENWFLDKMQNLTNVLFHLNPVKRESQLIMYLDLILCNIKAKGVWAFNIELMLQHLLDHRAEPELKYVNYVYHSEKTIRSIYDFKSEYFDALRKAKLIFQCQSVFHIVENSYKNKVKQFINLKDIFTDRNYKKKNELFVGMVESFNYANGFDSLVNALKINTLYKEGQNSHNTISNTINRVVTKMSPSELKQHKRTKKLFKDWTNHTQDLTTIETIYKQMKIIIEDGTAIRVDTEKEAKNKIKKVLKVNIEENDFKTIEQLHAEQPPQKSYKEQWYDAFGDEGADMSNSVLCVSHSDAQKQTDDFYRSWLLFKFNPTDTQRALLLENAYRLKTNQITIIELLMPAFPKLKQSLKVA
jgi:hypothetical protein